MITYAELIAALIYYPENGVFTWKWRTDRPLKWNSRLAGKQAGCTKTTDGYPRIGFKKEGSKRLYLCHRLAWLYVHGVWPKELDHIDGDPTNYRLANLRLATRQQNMANAGLRKDNTTGVKGVIKRNRRKPWYARICVDGHTKVIGSFATADEAKAAYAVAAKRYFGEYHSDGVRE